MKDKQIINPKIATILLGLSMFFTGASGLVNQYVLSTVSTYLLGNSIEQFSITIALMLGMMGVGSYYQKHISDNNLITKFIYIEIFLALLGSFAPIATFWAFSGLEDHFNIIYYTFVMSIGLLIGFEIPFIVRINEKYSPILRANLSSVIASDYIGSFVGAIIWVYYLLPNWSLAQISFIVSFTNLVIASLTFLYFTSLLPTRPKIFGYIMLTTTTIILMYGYTISPQVETSLSQSLYEDKIVSNYRTKYQILTLTHSKDFNETRLYINGNLQFSSLDENRYHEIMAHPVMHINKAFKKNVLILGGGDGLLLRELKKYKNIKNITLVDLDPDMVKFSKSNSYLSKLNQNSLSTPNVTILNSHLSSPQELLDIYSSNLPDKSWIGTINIMHIDAQNFFKFKNPKKFDVVYIDFPDPSSIELNKLYTKEFYSQLRSTLNPDAQVVIQSTSPYHSKESFLMIGRTLEAAGFHTTPFHLNIPSFGDWGWYMASTSPINPTLSKLTIKTDFLTPEVFNASLIFGKNNLESDDNSINTLFSPKLLNTYTNNSWLNY